MVFADKLTFLVNLTGTTNKQLGDILGIHQSQISRMRSGARGLPGNGEYIRLMSEHFASVCVNDYQRSALADVLGRPTLKLPLEKNVLAIIINEWFMGLLDDREVKAEQVLCSYRAFNIRYGSDKPFNDKTGYKFQTNQELYVYFGDDGKRMALRAFLGYIVQSGEPMQLDVSSDENLSWLVGDSSFAAEVQRYFPRLIEQGCTCRRIVGPMSNLDYSYVSMTMRWLSSYISGHVASFYYPRLRDDLYHKTMIIAPGKAAVFSSSTGKQYKAGATFFITDKAVVDALESEFENYVSLCVPHMVVYSAKQAPERFYGSFYDFENIQAPTLQRSKNLSVASMPINIVKSIRADDSIRYRLLLNNLIKRSKIFKQRLDEYLYIDIMSLADPSEVISEMIPIETAALFNNHPQFYTVNTYLMHLRNILRLADQKKNYCPVIINRQEDGLNAVYVKEGHRVLFQRDKDPLSVVEITERNLVAAFNELLHRSSPIEESLIKMRQNAISKIKEYIRRFE